MSAAFDRYRRLLQLPEADLPLDEACLLVSAHFHPGLDVGAQLERVDQLAAAVEKPTVDGVVAHLFGPGGFRGDIDDYANPANSFLDQVLDRRLGIPITLSVVAMEVARRVGADLVGVGMPGHFLLGDPERDRYLDVFSGGVVLDADACGRMFEAQFGSRHGFDPSWLAPVGRFSVLARVLANLKANFDAAGDHRSLARVLELRLEVPGVSAAERLELADALGAMGSFDKAADQLEGLADLIDGSAGPDGVQDGAVAERAVALRNRARRSRARLN